MRRIGQTANHPAAKLDKVAAQLENAEDCGEQYNYEYLQQGVGLEYNPEFGMGRFLYKLFAKGQTDALGNQ